MRYFSACPFSTRETVDMANPVRLDMVTSVSFMRRSVILFYGCRNPYGCRPRFWSFRSAPRSVLGLLFNLLSDLLPDLLFNRLSGRQSRLPE